MESTGYTPQADTLAAPASVADSVALMTRRFEQASAELDKETLKEEVLEVISGEAIKPTPPVIPSEAKESDPPVISSEAQKSDTPVISSEAEKSES
jgi:hypothetical protein